MPNSLRARLKKLKYQGLLSEEDLYRIVVLPPKIGHWINIDATHSKCDRCGAVFEIASENGEANYCPNYGARMIESEDKE